MKMRSLSVAILLIVIILGGVLLLQISGLWITEGSKVPTKITTGEFAGMADPSDIRGSYKLEDVNTNFGIPPITIATAFALDTSIKEAASYLVKDIEAIYGEMEDLPGDIGTDSVKLFVSLYNSIPYTAEEETYLPSTALNLLLQMGKITKEEFTILSEKSYTPTILPSEIEQNISPPLPSQEFTIKGNTTFQDLTNWGLTPTQIEKVLAGTIESKNETIRDAATKNGVEFSLYKNSFQDLLNNK